MKPAMKHGFASKYTSFFWFYSKLCILLLFLAYAVILFWVRLKGFSSDDPLPAVQAVTIEQRKEFREFASLVRTGLYVKNFSTFNMSKNIFVVDATLWFEFYGSQIGLDVINRFSINNATIRSKSPPDVKVVNDKLVATYQLVFELQSDLKFHAYPLTDHSLSIVVLNNFVTPSEMYFDDDDSAHSFNVSDNLFNSSWGVNSIKVQAALLREKLDRRDTNKIVDIPAVVYTINFEKRSFKELLILFLPLFAAGFFSWLSLLMNLSNEVGRFSLAITAVTAILGYRFVIEQVSPQVGYFTVLDKFYLFLLSFCFLMFVFQLILTAYWYVLSKRVEAEGDAQDRAAVQEVHGRVLKKSMDVVFVVSSFLMYGSTLYFLFY